LQSSPMVPPLEPVPELEPESQRGLESDGDLEQREQKVQFVPTSWMCTRFAHGDAVSSVQQLITESHDLEAVGNSRGAEAEVLMDMLQEVGLASQSVSVCTRIVLTCVRFPGSGRCLGPSCPRQPPDAHYAAPPRYLMWLRMSAAEGSITTRCSRAPIL
jgi:hypothetical protein